MARPSDYTPEIAAEICALIAEGASLIKIGLRDDMPSERAVYRWLAQHEEFRQNYARAREVQADHYADRAVDDALASTNDDAAAVRVRLDAIKWFASKVAPKKYGEAVKVAGGGPNGEILHEVAVKVSFE